MVLIYSKIIMPSKGEELLPLHMEYQQERYLEILFSKTAEQRELVEQFYC